MPTEKHPVPQHVMGIEFKLVGDLNVRQFFFLLGGGVLIFFLLRSGAPFYFKWPSALFFAMCTLIAAFVPLEGRRADQWIRSFFNSVFSPTQRIWKRSVSAPTFISDEFINSLRKEAYSVAPQNERWRLKRFIEEFEEKEEKTKLDLKIDQFLNNLNFDQPLPEGVAPKISKKIEIPKRERPEEVTAEKAEQERPEVTKPVEKEPSAKKRKVTLEESPTLAAEVNWSSENVITIPVAGAKQKRYVTTVSNVRPGRKLKNLPRIQGEIVMPVKGKRVIMPQGEEPDDIEGFKIKEDRTEELATPLHKGEEQPSQPEVKTEKAVDTLPYAPEEKEVEEDKEPITERIVSEKTKKTAQGLQEKINQLTRQISILGKRLKQAQTGGKDSQMADLYQKQIKQLEEEKDSLFKKGGKKIPQKEDEEKEKEKEKEKQEQEIARSISLKKKKKPSKKPAKAKKEEKAVEYRGLGAEPNIIHGVVRDKQGSVVSNAVIIVEDEEGNPVRALKTDPLGHFAITTKLPNGKYKIKTSRDDLKFGIMETQLKGETPPPLKIIAK